MLILLGTNIAFERILELSISQFAILTNAAGRRDAARRSDFVTDMSVVVGGVLGGGDSLKAHLASLDAVVKEE